MIVLDTNVISEMGKRESDPGLRDWMDRQDPQDLWITSTTVSELVAGVQQLPAGRRRETVSAANDRLIMSFEDATLSFERRAAKAYGELIAKRIASGRPISRADAQIAASCVAAGATLATHNTRDFDGIEGLDLIDPWESGN